MVCRVGSAQLVPSGVSEPASHEARTGVQMAFPVPPASASRRVLFVPVLVDESVHVPLPATPPSTSRPLASTVITWPAVNAPVEGRIVPLKFITVHVLSVLAIPEVSKMRNGLLPAIKPPPTVILPPDSLMTESPIVEALSAFCILPVVNPDKPPVLDVPQLH